MAKHTFTTSSNPLTAAREAMRFARMVVREAAAVADPDSHTKLVLEQAVGSLSSDLLDLDEALDDDAAERAEYVACNPLLPLSMPDAGTERRA